MQTRYMNKNKYMIIKSTSKNSNFSTPHYTPSEETFFSKEEKMLMEQLSLKLKQEEFKPSTTSLQIIREYNIRTSNKQMATEF